MVQSLAFIVVGHVPLLWFTDYQLDFDVGLMSALEQIFPHVSEEELPINGFEYMHAEAHCNVQLRGSNFQNKIYLIAPL